MSPVDDGPGDAVRLRRTGVVVIAVVVGLLTPVALLARCARELRDADRYVATVAPLARDPAIQDQVADDVTNEVFRRLDVEGIVRDALQRLADQGAPDAVVGLATPIADQVHAFTRDEVRALVATERFATLWDEANRVSCWPPTAARGCWRWRWPWWSGRRSQRWRPTGGPAPSRPGSAPTRHPITTTTKAERSLRTARHI